jgi:hypothetical protein
MKLPKAIIIIVAIWILILSVMVIQLYKRSRLTNEYLGTES